MIGLDEAGAAATQMVAGATKCGQYTWNEDSQAHEEEGRAGGAVSYLVDEKNTIYLVYHYYYYIYTKSANR